MANRTIGTEIKLQGEKEFNSQMKALNSGLKTTKSDMAALSAEFEDNANSTKALAEKQKLLQRSVDQHKAKVAALRSQYEAAASTLGENAATTQKYKQQLNAAAVALAKETAALQKNAAALAEAKKEECGNQLPAERRTQWSGMARDSLQLLLYHPLVSAYANGSGPGGRRGLR